MWRMLLSNVFVEQIVPLLPSFKCPSMDERSLISTSFLRKREWSRCRWRRRGFSLCSSIVLLSHFLSLTSFVSVSLLHLFLFYIFSSFSSFFVSIVDCARRKSWHFHFELRMMCWGGNKENHNSLVRLLNEEFFLWFILSFNSPCYYL